MTKEIQKIPKMPRVLVVEDKLINRKMLRKILSNDYECVEAENGKEALAVLEKSFNTIDIVILDLQMPIMTGVEFLEVVKDDTRFNQIPIIIATTSEDLEVEHHALELGAIDYISKPYNPLIIRNRLRMICEVREKAILQFENERDQLTKIYNKQKFFQVVESKLANGLNGNNFVITFDIENFKLFNELYGMPEGDELLIYIAKVIADSVDFFSDVYCRLDRDNFAIYVEKNKDLLFPFLRKIEKKIKLFNINYNISLYFGIYEIVDTTTTVNMMCDRANMAIEDVKGMYEKNIVYYLDTKRITLLKEQELLTDMMKAFDNDEYQYFIQPKVNMATGELIGGEALARWISDKRGLVSPGDFIPLAEKSGLISKIDFCIWGKVCYFLRKRLDAGKPIVPISVNISRVELYNKNLIVVLNNLVKKYQLDKKYLILEITETVYMENPEQMVQIVRKLQEEGYSIHMDDFGSGYSSLNMLNELKFDVIKLDLRFMSNINADKKNENIVGFIMSLANWLNVEVIAEGVETAEQMEFLRSIGCIYGQGYLLGRPTPPEKFEQLLDSDIHIIDVINTEPTINVVKLNDLWDTKSSFSLLFQTFIGGICLIENNNNNFNLIRGNDAFYSIFGVTHDNLKYVKTQILSYIDEKDMHKINDTVIALSKNADSQPIELEIKLSNGERKFLHCNAKTIFRQKKYMYFLVSIEDLTELKLSQEKELLKEKCLRLELQTEKNAFERIYNAI
ncbi:MAG: EAL domain-containing protein, partial [Clostridia bacterium]